MTNEVLALGALNEADATRLYQHLTNNDEEWAIISSYISNKEIDVIQLAREGKSAFQSLKNEVRAKYKLGYSHLIFRWVDTYGTKYDKETLVIYGISYKDAMALGEKYNQKSIIMKDNKGCGEIVSTEIFNSVTLKEIYEVHPPRPSYFQTEYRIEKVYENKQIVAIAN